MNSQERQIIRLKERLLSASQEIEKLSKAKSDFLSLVSHELWTPLTSLKESISIVLDGIAGPLNDRQKEFLNIAINNLNRVSNIIIDILDFSTLSSGRMAMHKERLNINEIIKRVYASFNENLGRNNLRFELSLDDGLEPAWFDPKRIREVLKNLISNSIKFNRGDGKIKISTARATINKKKFIKVSIEDEGIGISKKNIPRLFNDFSPLDNSMTRAHRGVGLGLSICKGIVGLHGGRIWAESEEDRGSRFIFTLPITDDKI